MEENWTELFNQIQDVKAIIIICTLAIMCWVAGYNIRKKS